MSMSKQLEPTRSHTPVLKRAAAGLVLVAIAAFAVHLVISFFITIFWIVAVVAVVVAAAWALNTIF